MMFVELCLSANVCNDESAPGPPEGDVLGTLVHTGRMLHGLVLK